MSVLKIYGDAISGNCNKVRWTADYLGLVYEWIEINVLNKESRTPEFLKLHAGGQVPVIVTPDGKALAQSNAIILYLAETNDSDLIPANDFLRAQMYEWLFWEQYNHEPYIAVRRFQKLYLKKPEDAIAPHLAERGNDALRRMETALAHSSFFVGDFSLADIALAGYTRVAHEGGFDLSAYPAVRRWIGDVEQKLRIGSV